MKKRMRFSAMLAGAVMLCNTIHTTPVSALWWWGNAASEEFQDMTLLDDKGMFKWIGYGGVPGTPRDYQVIDELDEKNNEKVVVIDKTTQEQLFDFEEDPIGKLIFVNNIAYKVIGVWEGNPNSGGGEAYMPFSTLKKITNQNDYFMLNFTTYDLDTKEANEAFETYLRTQLANLHEFDPTDESSIYISSTMLNYLETNKILNTLQVFIWIIGIAMLISGIVGVSNIMRITVKERTNEIGIRKAIGAKSRSILASIVVESMMITTLFGYIGMWLGMVVAEVSGNIISKVQEGNMVTINIVPSIDIRIVLLATALLIVCGVLAGFFPARNAVKIKPIEAMNYR